MFRSISSGANPMSEAEMDAHTIRNMREQSIADGQPPKALVSLNPTDPLKAVIDKLFQKRCSMAPVLTLDAHGMSEPAFDSILLLPSHKRVFSVSASGRCMVLFVERAASEFFLQAGRCYGTAEEDGGPVDCGPCRS